MSCYWLRTLNYIYLSEENPYTKLPSENGELVILIKHQFTDKKCVWKAYKARTDFISLFKITVVPVNDKQINMKYFREIITIYLRSFCKSESRNVVTQILFKHNASDTTMRYIVSKSPKYKVLWSRGKELWVRNFKYHRNGIKAVFKFVLNSFKTIEVIKMRLSYHNSD